MSRVLVNEALRSLLHNLSEPLELCDESGQVLGRFLPTGELAEHKPYVPSISEEELQRREQEPDYSTAEVLAYLEKL